MVVRHRLHHDAVSFVGTVVNVATDGASSIEVPEGASGILFQGHSEAPNSEHTYLSFSNEVTQEEEGLEVEEFVWKVWWFNPRETTHIHIFNEVNAEFRYQFLKPAVERY